MTKAKRSEPETYSRAYVRRLKRQLLAAESKAMDAWKYADRLEIQDMESKAKTEYYQNQVLILEATNLALTKFLGVELKPGPRPQELSFVNSLGNTLARIEVAMWPGNG